jgi:hypothetical protein
MGLQLLRTPVNAALTSQNEQRLPRAEYQQALTVV